MTVFVNKFCDCGPHLNRDLLISRLPTEFGPGSMNRLLRDVVQSIVNVAKDKSFVFERLKAGNGKMVVTAEFEGRTNVRKMPHLNGKSTFWTYLCSWLDEIKSCSNLLSSRRLASICDKCSNSASTRPLIRIKTETKTSGDNVLSVSSLKRKSGSADTEAKSSIKPLATPPTTVVRPAKIPKAVTSNQQIFSTPPTKSSAVIVQSARISTPSQPSISPQTPTAHSVSSQPLSSNPTEWSIDDVIRYLSLKEPTLEQHAETFRKHVSDTCVTNSQADTKTTQSEL